MGKVFTASELHANAVPRPEAFSAAADFLMQAVVDLNEVRNIEAYAPETTGVLVFGSTSTGTATSRSDLDVLIAYRPDRHPKSAALTTYQGVFRNIYDIYSVPVESTIESVDNLKNGEHSLDPIFLQNLLSVPAWLGQNPAHIANPGKQTWTDAFRAYAMSKDRKFSKAMTDSTALDEKVMQRALELPVALGRKAVGILEGDTESRTKTDVMLRLQTIIDRARVSKQFDWLVSADSAYTEVLAATVSGNVPVQEHTDWLQHTYRQTLAAAVDYTQGIRDYVLTQD